jgi:4-methyl-5(b-hydroxyethyl)-thiazole monophosphate biosynthesis
MAQTVVVFLADGCEPIEALGPIDVLRRGGVEVAMASISQSLTVNAAHNIRIEADALLSEVDLPSFDMAIVPGGSVGVENLCKSLPVCEELKRRMNAGQLTAAICAGPLVLNQEGLLEGRKAVCYPGCEEGWSEGIYQPNKRVFVDANLITAVGPGAALEFGIVLLRALKGEEAANNAAAGMLI